MSSTIELENFLFFNVFFLLPQKLYKNQMIYFSILMKKVINRFSSAKQTYIAKLLLKMIVLQSRQIKNKELGRCSLVFLKLTRIWKDEF